MRMVNWSNLNNFLSIKLAMVCYHMRNIISRDSCSCSFLYMLISLTSFDRMVIDVAVYICLFEQFVKNATAALHELDPVFKEFSSSRIFARLLSSFGYKRPVVIQSMYIFKVQLHISTGHMSFSLCTFSLCSLVGLSVHTMIRKYWHWVPKYGSLSFRGLLEVLTIDYSLQDISMGCCNFNRV